MINAGGALLADLLIGNQIGEVVIGAVDVGDKQMARRLIGVIKIENRGAGPSPTAYSAARRASAEAGVASAAMKSSIRSRAAVIKQTIRERRIASYRRHAE